jgi:hypothetical protein
METIRDIYSELVRMRMKQNINGSDYDTIYFDLCNIIENIEEMFE